MAKLTLQLTTDTGLSWSVETDYSSPFKVDSEDFKMLERGLEVLGFDLENQDQGTPIPADMPIVQIEDETLEG